MSTETNIHSSSDSSPNEVLGRVGEAVCALDDEWQFTFVNDQAAAMLGHAPEELLGEELWETVPDIDGGAVGEKLREAMETQDTVRFDNYDDSLERWFQVRVYPSEDGVTACFYDITEDRGKRLDLQRGQRLFEAVFTETEDALVVADTDRRITDFNSAAERLFGYDADEVIGEKSLHLYADPEDHETQGKQRFNETVPEQDGTYVVEYERADGTTFEGETFGTPLKGPDGETLAFLGSIRDISARVKHEQEIKSRNESLRTFQEIVTDERLTFDQQVKELLELGTDHLGLDIGVFSRGDDADFTVEHATMPDDTVQSVDRFDCLGLYRDLVVDSGEVVAIKNAGESEHERFAGPELEIESYIGVPVVVDGDQHGILNFLDTEPRQQPFAEGKQTFVRVLAQWIGKELSRQHSQERAAANQERLRQIIDMLPQLVFAKDSDGEFLLANQAVAEVYGTTVEELEGATDADFADSRAEARQFREDDLAVIDSGEPKEIPEETLTTADGETMVCQTTKIPYDPADHDREAILGVSTDITARKERERELKIQAAAMEAAMDGIAILDGDEYIYMNQAHADIFDFDPEELLGSEWRRVYGQAEIERLEAEVFPALAEDGEWRGETIGMKRDGTPVNQEITLSLLDDGKLICTNRDITERKAQRKELKRYREVVRASGDAIYALDSHGTITMVNDTHAEYAGYPRDELVGSHVSEFMPEEDVKKGRELLNDILADPDKTRGTFEMRGVRPDGTVRRYEDNVAVLTDDDGEFAGSVGVIRDITERKERERELERQRTRVRALFDESPDGIIVHDAEGNVLDANETQRETLGLDRETLLSMNVAEFEVGISQPALAEKWSTMNIGDVLKVEGEHRRQDGSTVPVEVWVDKVEVEGNERYIAVSRDITERKARENKLRESRRSLRKLTDIASDTDRTFEAKLSALLELGAERLGLPYGFLNRIDQGTQHVVQSVGDHPQLQTGGSAPKSESYCRKTITQEGVLGIQDAAGEGWADDPAHERFGLGCYIGGKVIVDGDKYGTLCFADHASRDHAFDDTERAFVELLVQWISYELTSNTFETKLRGMNETAQQLITAHSREEIAALTVESARSVLDLPVNGVWWHDESASTLVPETQTEKAAELFSEQPRLEQGSSLAHDVFTANEVRAYEELSEGDGMHDDDTVLESEVLVPLGDHGLMSAGSTEPQAFSEADLNLLEVLSSTTEAALSRAEREQELRETRAELKQSNEELEQFAYAASHDLQEPLRTVSSYLTLLKRRYDEDLDSDGIEFIDFAVDGADRMRDMIQALLAYSRVDTRGEEFEPVNVSTIFERVTQDLRVTIEETDATVSTPTTELTVSGDGSQLVQLFQNLIENGIKYNTDPRVIDVSVTRHDESVTFDVTDNGVGMQLDQADDIFEVFNRLHTREEFEGTGIGLSICQKIAERHGGEISVESEPGEGSTFSVVLPIGDAHDA